MTDELLTVTQVKKFFHFTDKMLKHLTPAQTYRRLGQLHPIKLYRISDIIEFRDSPLGKQLMAEAEERRKRFWNGVMRAIPQPEQQNTTQPGLPIIPGPIDFKEAQDLGLVVNPEELFNKDKGDEDVRKPDVEQTANLGQE